MGHVCVGMKIGLVGEHMPAAVHNRGYAFYCRLRPGSAIDKELHLIMQELCIVDTAVGLGDSSRVSNFLKHRVLRFPVHSAHRGRLLEMSLSGDSSDEDLMSTFRATQRVVSGARVSTLNLKDGLKIDTPHFVGITSRGVVPHVAPDALGKQVQLKGAYIALEDFLEKPFDKTAFGSASYHGTKQRSINRFLALPDDVATILGPRRIPPIVSASTNSQTAVSISTSVGFRWLESEDYVRATRRLRPDIVVGLGDLSFREAEGRRRVEKMSARTEKWTAELVDGLKEDDTADDSQTAPSTKVFAPILPIDFELQSWYISAILEDLGADISGLAFYNDESAASLIPRIRGSDKQSDDLFCLSLSPDEKRTPHDILRNIAYGIDLFALSSVNSSADSGIAFDFTFPPADIKVAAGEAKMPLAVDMWLPSHATDVSPLSKDCACYTCTRHHRAYIRHLLDAKEMLAWVLLQVHNMHALNRFFEAVRHSIRSGSFEEDSRRFEEAYENSFPEKTGLGPRIRGYQVKSEGPGEAKKNQKAFNTLEGGREVNEDSPLTPGLVVEQAEQLEQQGFGEKSGQ